MASSVCHREPTSRRPDHNVACWIGSQSQTSTSACSPNTASWSRSSPCRLTPTACVVLCAASGTGAPVRGVIESMTGARFVHDTLEHLGWEVLIADAQKVKGLAPLTCKTDQIDARVLGGALRA